MRSSYPYSVHRWTNLRTQSALSRLVIPAVTSDRASASETMLLELVSMNSSSSCSVYGLLSALEFVKRR